MCRKFQDKLLRARGDVEISQEYRSDVYIVLFSMFLYPNKNFAGNDKKKRDVCVARGPKTLELCTHGVCILLLVANAMEQPHMVCACIRE